MKIIKCKHNSIHIIFSPDDDGYYVECYDCWKTFPVKSTRTEAYQELKKNRA